MAGILGDVDLALGPFIDGKMISLRFCTVVETALDGDFYGLKNLVTELISYPRPVDVLCAPGDEDGLVAEHLVVLVLRGGPSAPLARLALLRRLVLLRASVHVSVVPDLRGRGGQVGRNAGQDYNAIAFLISKN